MHTTLPLDSPLRQQVIDELSCFEGVKDELFDELIALATQHFSVPIALISILDKNRQWFWAQAGIKQNQTPLIDSFCATAIESNEFFEVIDASNDERFSNNSLVLGSPGIRFYAGCPLITPDGIRLGMLCVIDTKPRPPLTQAEQETLLKLAAIVMLRIRELRSSNYIDPTIGLYNRIKFEQDVEEFNARRESVTVLAADMISPAFLNEIVKSLGYPFSTTLMHVLKEKLQNLIGGLNLYKISPTRFGVMIPGQPDITEFANRLVQEMEKSVECLGIPIQPRTGLGIIKLSSSAWNDDWLRCLVSTADHARHQGKGWIYFKPELDNAQVRAFTLLTSLSKAVQVEDQFYLEYQPRIDVNSGEMHAVEALLRWEHPTLGKVSPSEFIPLAEKTPLIRRLSDWVVNHTLDQMVTWKSKGYNWKVSINVSAADMADSAFVDRLIKLAEIKGVDASQIELEFTESALVADPETTKANLLRIRAVGIELSIDDFGTGYSNWSYLRDLPASTVKIDQSFMREVQSNKRDQTMVTSIIRLAQEIGYQVVAEGIETEETYRLLKAFGCNQVQGYLFAAPMRASALEEWFSGYTIAEFPD